jgi:hypothetical protein
MFKIQDQVGNKWALISSKLPGRYDSYELGLTTVLRTISIQNSGKVCGS